MKLYRLIEGSYSHDHRDTSGVENLYTKEDVIYWAEDVASMISEDDEHEIGRAHV